jgi:hypothetical protein
LVCGDGSRIGCGDPEHGDAGTGEMDHKEIHDRVGQEHGKDAPQDAAKDERGDRYWRNLIVARLINPVG